MPISERNQVLPGYEPLPDFDHPKNYIVEEGLRQAVNVALALGQAILLTKPWEEVKGYLPASLQGKGPTRSVVLIDEIDKAPRDLPNDVLNEVEKMEFTVKETGHRRVFRLAPGVAVAGFGGNCHRGIIGKEPGANGQFCLRYLSSAPGGPAVDAVP